ncbi:MAG: LbtU family siderophore porin [Desulfobacterales bacterium]|nr:MAG: LbtU family siderophore porin [Desulfobacterales bacterium]
MSKVKTKAHAWLLFFALFVCVLWPFYQVEAQESEETHEVKQRLEKIEELEEDEKDELDITPAFLRPFVDRATLHGFVELNFDYIDPSDIEDEDSESTSELYVNSVELALRVFFNEWVKTKIVVNAEDLGKGDETEEIKLDEAIVTLESPWIPMYFIGGKTVLPFGVFEDRMISGTITEDLYEIDDWGVILVFATDFCGLDISISVYEGQNIIENLEDFGAHEFSPDRKKEDGVDSFIANVTLEPMAELLNLAAFYENEPGDGNRNQSLGGALTFNVWKFILDAEFITALEREKGANGEENKENAWFVALAFQPFEKLELATRYEDFDDDVSGDQDEILDYRYSAGLNYSFSDFNIFSFEYRHSKFEKEKGSHAADDQDEFFFQLALGF